MKFKNMKRFGSILMAGALALSLVVPAFAESANTQTVVDGGYVTIPISVIVPTTGSAQINPYGLPVVVSATANGDPISITNQQITNIPMYIGNYGTVALDVSASLAVLPKGESVSIKGGALATADKGKQMNVTLEVAGLDDAAYAKVIDSEALVLSFHEAFADDATWAGAQSLVAPAAAAKATTVTAAKSPANTPLATLGAATVNGETITYGNDSVALFRLKGDMNAEPVKGASGSETDDPWTEDDGFTATIVFKFTPNTNAGGGGTSTPSVAASMTGTPTAGGSVTLNAAISNIDASKNPTYSWVVTTDADSIVDSFTDSTAAAQTVNIAAGATTGQSATLTVTVTYDDQGSGDATVTDTVTITIP